MRVGNDQRGTAALENVGRCKQGRMIRNSAINYSQSDATPLAVPVPEEGDPDGVAEARDY